jgi:hypothetical protein
MILKECTDVRGRSRLLPGGSGGLYVVVFWRASDPVASDFRRACADIVWPQGCIPVAVDLDQAPEMIDWFELSTVPMLAVISDGSLLGLEYECTVDACRRLVESGFRQYSLMRSMA